ncbi:hypothetical protein BsWGS_26345 [Bradybaena similaris]
MVRETRYLIVRNLPESCTEQTLIDHFQRYGKIQSVKLQTAKDNDTDSTATVAFNDIKSAAKAHHAKNLIGEVTLRTDYWEGSTATPVLASTPVVGNSTVRSAVYTSTTPASSRLASTFSSWAKGPSDEDGSSTHDKGDTSQPPPPGTTTPITASPALDKLSSTAFDLQRGRGRDRIKQKKFGQKFEKCGGSFGRHGTTTSTRSLEAARSQSEAAAAAAAAVASSSATIPSQVVASSSGASISNGGTAGLNPIIVSDTKEVRELKESNRESSSRSRPHSVASPSSRNSGVKKSNSHSRSVSRSRSRSRGSRSSSSRSHSSGTSQSTSPHRSHTSSTARPQSMVGSSRLVSSEVKEAKRDDNDERRPLGICVMGLPTRSTDSSLRDGLYHEYKKQGKVTTVQICGDGENRCAIISFRKPEDAIKALEASQGKTFFGSQIKVVSHEGVEVDDADRGNDIDSLDEYHVKSTRTLFVGNLEKETTQQDLIDKFQQYGEIIDVDIKRQGATTAFAFVQYADIVSVVSALRAMEGEHIGINKIKLGFGKSMPTDCVWLDCLPTSTSNRSLRSTLGRYGEVIYCYIDRHRNKGLVYFSSYEDAQRCVSDIKARPHVMKKKLQIDFASRECQNDFFNRMERTNQLRANERPDDSNRVHRFRQQRSFDSFQDDGRQEEYGQSGQFYTSKGSTDDYDAVLREYGHSQRERRERDLSPRHSADRHGDSQSRQSSRDHSLDRYEKERTVEIYNSRDTSPGSDHNSFHSESRYRSSRDEKYPTRDRYDDAKVEEKDFEHHSRVSRNASPFVHNHSSSHSHDSDYEHRGGSRSQSPPTPIQEDSSIHRIYYNDEYKRSVEVVDDYSSYSHSQKQKDSDDVTLKSKLVSFHPSKLGAEVLKTASKSRKRMHDESVLSDVGKLDGKLLRKSEKISLLLTEKGKSSDKDKKHHEASRHVLKVHDLTTGSPGSSGSHVDSENGSVSEGDLHHLHQEKHHILRKLQELNEEGIGTSEPDSPKSVSKIKSVAVKEALRLSGRSHEDRKYDDAGSKSEVHRRQGAKARGVESRRESRSHLTEEMNSTREDKNLIDEKEESVGGNSDLDYSSDFRRMKKRRTESGVDIASVKGKGYRRPSSVDISDEENLDQKSDPGFRMLSGSVVSRVSCDSRVGSKSYGEPSKTVEVSSCDSSDVFKGGLSDKDISVIKQSQTVSKSNTFFPNKDWNMDYGGTVRSPVGCFSPACSDDPTQDSVTSGSLTEKSSEHPPSPPWQHTPTLPLIGQDISYGEYGYFKDFTIPSNLSPDDCLSDDSLEGDLLPAPGEPSVEERIRVIDEMLNMTVSSKSADPSLLVSVLSNKDIANNNDNTALYSKFRIRKREGGLDGGNGSLLTDKKPEPSVIMQQVLSKKSILDQDFKRLEQMCEKYDLTSGREIVKTEVVSPKLVDPKGDSFFKPLLSPSLLSPSLSHPVTTSSSMLQPTITTSVAGSTSSFSVTSSSVLTTSVVSTPITTCSIYTLPKLAALDASRRLKVKTSEASLEIPDRHSICTNVLTLKQEIVVSSSSSPPPSVSHPVLTFTNNSLTSSVSQSVTISLPGTLLPETTTTQQSCKFAVSPSSLPPSLLSASASSASTSCLPSTVHSRTTLQHSVLISPYISSLSSSSSLSVSQSTSGAPVAAPFTQGPEKALLTPIVGQEAPRLCSPSFTPENSRTPGTSHMPGSMSPRVASHTTDSDQLQKTNGKTDLKVIVSSDGDSKTDELKANTGISPDIESPVSVQSESSSIASVPLSSIDSKTHLHLHEKTLTIPPVISQSTGSLPVSDVNFSVKSSDSAKTELVLPVLDMEKTVMEMCEKNQQSLHENVVFFETKAADILVSKEIKLSPPFTSQTILSVSSKDHFEKQQSVGDTTCTSGSSISSGKGKLSSSSTLHMTNDIDPTSALKALTSSSAATSSSVTSHPVSKSSFDKNDKKVSGKLSSNSSKMSSGAVKSEALFAPDVKMEQIVKTSDSRSDPRHQPAKGSASKSSSSDRKSAKPPPKDSHENKDLQSKESEKSDRRLDVEHKNFSVHESSKSRDIHKGKDKRDQSKDSDKSRPKDKEDKKKEEKKTSEKKSEKKLVTTKDDKKVEKKVDDRKDKNSEKTKSGQAKHSKSESSASKQDKKQKEKVKDVKDKSGDKKVTAGLSAKHAEVKPDSKSVPKTDSKETTSAKHGTVKDSSIKSEKEGTQKSEAVGKSELKTKHKNEAKVAGKGLGEAKSDSKESLTAAKKPAQVSKSKKEQEKGGSKQNLSKQGHKLLKLKQSDDDKLKEKQKAKEDKDRQKDKEREEKEVKEQEEKQKETEEERMEREDREREEKLKEERERQKELEREEKEREMKEKEEKQQKEKEQKEKERQERERQKEKEREEKEKQKEKEREEKEKQKEKEKEERERQKEKDREEKERQKEEKLRQKEREKEEKERQKEREREEKERQKEKEKEEKERQKEREREEKERQKEKEKEEKERQRKEREEKERQKEEREEKERQKEKEREEKERQKKDREEKERLKEKEREEKERQKEKEREQKERQKEKEDKERKEREEKDKQKQKEKDEKEIPKEKKIDKKMKIKEEKPKEKAKKEKPKTDIKADKKGKEKKAKEEKPKKDKEDKLKKEKDEKNKKDKEEKEKANREKEKAEKERKEKEEKEKKKAAPKKPKRNELAALLEHNDMIQMSFTSMYDRVKTQRNREPDPQHKNEPAPKSSFDKFKQNRKKSGSKVKSSFYTFDTSSGASEGDDLDELSDLSDQDSTVKNDSVSETKPKKSKQVKKRAHVSSSSSCEEDDDALLSATKPKSQKADKYNAIFSSDSDDDNFQPPSKFKASVNGKSKPVAKRRKTREGSSDSMASRDEFLKPHNLSSITDSLDDMDVSEEEEIKSKRKKTKAKPILSSDHDDRDSSMESVTRKTAKSDLDSSLESVSKTPIKVDKEESPSKKTKPESKKVTKTHDSKVNVKERPKLANDKKKGKSEIEKGYNKMEISSKTEAVKQKSKVPSESKSVEKSNVKPEADQAKPKVKSATKTNGEKAKHKVASEVTNVEKAKHKVTAEVTNVEKTKHKVTAEVIAEPEKDKLKDKSREEDKPTTNKPECKSAADKLIVVSENKSVADKITIVSDSKSTADKVSVVSDSKSTADKVSVVSDSKSTADKVSVVSDSKSTADKVGVVSDSKYTADKVGVVSESKSVADKLSIVSESKSTAEKISVISESKSTADKISVVFESKSTADKISVVSESKPSEQVTIVSESKSTADKISAVSESALPMGETKSQQETEAKTDTEKVRSKSEEKQKAKLDIESKSHKEKSTVKIELNNKTETTVLTMQVENLSDTETAKSKVELGNKSVDKVMQSKPELQTKPDEDRPVSMEIEVKSDDDSLREGRVEPEAKPDEERSLSKSVPSNDAKSKFPAERKKKNEDKEDSVVKKKKKKKYDPLKEEELVDSLITKVYDKLEREKKEKKKSKLPFFDSEAEDSSAQSEASSKTVSSHTEKVSAKTEEIEPAKPKEEKVDILKESARLEKHADAKPVAEEVSKVAKKKNRKKKDKKDQKESVDEIGDVMKAQLEKKNKDKPDMEMKQEKMVKSADRSDDEHLKPPRKKKKKDHDRDADREKEKGVKVGRSPDQKSDTEKSLSVGSEDNMSDDKSSSQFVDEFTSFWGHPKPILIPKRLKDSKKSDDEKVKHKDHKDDLKGGGTDGSEAHSNKDDSRDGTEAKLSPAGDKASETFQNAGQMPDSATEADRTLKMELEMIDDLIVPISEAETTVITETTSVGTIDSVSSIGASLHMHEESFLEVPAAIPDETTIGSSVEIDDDDFPSLIIDEVPESLEKKVTRKDKKLLKKQQVKVLNDHMDEVIASVAMALSSDDEDQTSLHIDSISNDRELLLSDVINQELKYTSKISREPESKSASITDMLFVDKDVKSKQSSMSSHGSAQKDKDTSGGTKKEQERKKEIKIFGQLDEETKKRDEELLKTLAVLCDPNLDRPVVIDDSKREPSPEAIKKKEEADKKKAEEERIKLEEAKKKEEEEERKKAEEEKKKAEEEKRKKAEEEKKKAEEEAKKAAEEREKAEAERKKAEEEEERRKIKEEKKRIEEEKQRAEEEKKRAEEEKKRAEEEEKRKAEEEKTRREKEEQALREASDEAARAVESLLEFQSGYDQEPVDVDDDLPPLFIEPADKEPPVETVTMSPSADKNDLVSIFSSPIPDKVTANLDDKLLEKKLDEKGSMDQTDSKLDSFSLFATPTQTVTPASVLTSPRRNSAGIKEKTPEPVTSPHRQMQPSPQMHTSHRMQFPPQRTLPSPQGQMQSPQGQMQSPQSQMQSPQSQLQSPQKSAMSPQMDVHSPQPALHPQRSPFFGKDAAKADRNFVLSNTDVPSHSHVEIPHGPQPQRRVSTALSTQPILDQPLRPVQVSPRRKSQEILPEQLAVSSRRNTIATPEDVSVTHLDRRFPSYMGTDIIFSKERTHSNSSLPPPVSISLDHAPHDTNSQSPMQSLNIPSHQDNILLSPKKASPVLQFKERTPDPPVFSSGPSKSALQEPASHFSKGIIQEQIFAQFPKCPSQEQLFYGAKSQASELFRPNKVSGDNILLHAKSPAPEKPILQPNRAADSLLMQQKIAGPELVLQHNKGPHHVLDPFPQLEKGVLPSREQMFSPKSQPDNPFNYTDQNIDFLLNSPPRNNLTFPSFPHTTEVNLPPVTKQPDFSQDPLFIAATEAGSRPGDREPSHIRRTEGFPASFYQEPVPGPKTHQDKVTISLQQHQAAVEDDKKGSRKRKRNNKKATNEDRAAALAELQAIEESVQANVDSIRKALNANQAKAAAEKAHMVGADKKKMLDAYDFEAHIGQDLAGTPGTLASDGGYSSYGETEARPLRSRNERGRGRGNGPRRGRRGRGAISSVHEPPDSHQRSDTFSPSQPPLNLHAQNPDSLQPQMQQQHPLQQFGLSQQQLPPFQRQTQQGNHQPSHAFSQSHPSPVSSENSSSLPGPDWQQKQVSQPYPHSHIAPAQQQMQQQPPPMRLSVPKSDVLSSESNKHDLDLSYGESELIINLDDQPSSTEGKENQYSLSSDGEERSLIPSPSAPKSQRSTRARKQPDYKAIASGNIHPPAQPRSSRSGSSPRGLGNGANSPRSMSPRTRSTESMSSSPVVKLEKLEVGRTTRSRRGEIASKGHVKDNDSERVPPSTAIFEEPKARADAEENKSVSKENIYEFVDNEHEQVIETSLRSARARKKRVSDQEFPLQQQQLQQPLPDYMPASPVSGSNSALFGQESRHAFEGHAPEEKPTEESPKLPHMSNVDAIIDAVAKGNFGSFDDDPPIPAAAPMTPAAVPATPAAAPVTPAAATEPEHAPAPPTTRSTRRSTELKKEAELKAEKTFIIAEPPRFEGREAGRKGPTVPPLRIKVAHGAKVEKSEEKHYVIERAKGPGSTTESEKPPLAFTVKLSDTGTAIIKSAVGTSSTSLASPQLSVPSGKHPLAMAGDAFKTDNLQKKDSSIGLFSGLPQNDQHSSEVDIKPSVPVSQPPPWKSMDALADETVVSRSTGALHPKVAAKVQASQESQINIVQTQTSLPQPVQQYPPSSTASLSALSKSSPVTPAAPHGIKHAWSSSLQQDTHHQMGIPEQASSGSYLPSAYHQNLPQMSSPLPRDAQIMQQQQSAASHPEAKLPPNAHSQPVLRSERPGKAGKPGGMDINPDLPSKLTAEAQKHQQGPFTFPPHLPPAHSGQRQFIMPSDQSGHHAPHFPSGSLLKSGSDNRPAKSPSIQSQVASKIGPEVRTQTPPVTPGAMLYAGVVSGQPHSLSPSAASPEGQVIERIQNPIRQAESGQSQSPLTLHLPGSHHQEAVSRFMKDENPEGSGPLGGHVERTPSREIAMYQQMIEHQRLQQHLMIAEAARNSDPARNIAAAMRNVLESSRNTPVVLEGGRKGSLPTSQAVGHGQPLNLTPQSDLRGGQPDPSRVTPKSTPPAPQSPFSMQYYERKGESGRLPATVAGSFMQPSPGGHRGEGLAPHLYPELSLANLPHSPYMVSRLPIDPRIYASGQQPPPHLMREGVLSGSFPQAFPPGSRFPGLEHPEGKKNESGHPEQPGPHMLRSPSPIQRQMQNDALRQQLTRMPCDLPTRDSPVGFLQRYPVMWQGALALKNDNSYVQMHFIAGNRRLPNQALPQPMQNGALPPLRISQRMRLEHAQLEGVTKRMQCEDHYCILIAVACGRDQIDINQQTRALNEGFITYLLSKQAAGIVNVPLPGSEQVRFVVHIFPPCEFVDNSVAQQGSVVLMEQLREVPHAVVIIATT